jgi:hypothetical protein
LHDGLALSLHLNCNALADASHAVECADILGGLRPSPVFIDSSGQSIMSGGSVSPGEGTIYVIDRGSGGVPHKSAIPWYNKTTTWIVTPKVPACAPARARASGAMADSLA